MVAVPVGLALALFLNQAVFGIRLIKSLFFFPFVISQVVIGLIFTWFMSELRSDRAGFVSGLGRLGHSGR